METRPGGFEKLEKAGVSQLSDESNNKTEIGKRLNELRYSFAGRWKDKYPDRVDDSIDPVIHKKLEECQQQLQAMSAFSETSNQVENGGSTAILSPDFKWGNIFAKVDKKIKVERLSLQEDEKNVNKEEAKITGPSLRGNAYTGISYRRFKPEDIFAITRTNLDPMVETYGIGFYLHYAVSFPDYFIIAEHAGQPVAYIMGKDEGDGENYHGHVTALTVVDRFRKRRIATFLMEKLEKTSEKKNCYFVDLFVRKSNVAAIRLYESLGYIVYREIIDYYTGEKPENAYDMRKALPRDVKKKSVIPLKHPVHANDAD
ncbi:unnamed protein product, partial [Mesorhabditis belari]|uniref:N-alpha-acetyltransferase 20 n=1 Tax=Mesorhabditis belari TaxID=2138241 RepID=A0AAF3FS58_9BILA